MKIVIVGPESSGNRWVSSIFRKHPDLEIYSASFPRCRVPQRHYPNIHKLIEPCVATKNDLLVILTRDQTITSISAVQHGEFNFTQSINSIHQNIQKWAGQVDFFSYETFLAWKIIYLSHFCERNGINPLPFQETKIEFKDSNPKYINKQYKVIQR
jgi:hypothetical protein